MCDPSISDHQIIRSNGLNKRKSDFFEGAGEQITSMLRETEARQHVVLSGLNSSVTKTSLQIRTVSSFYTFHKAHVKFTTGLAQDFPTKP